MKLEEFTKKKKNVLKILTILIYVISILIYEIGICNVQNLFFSNEISYNFSLCRIVIYVIFFILLFKYIDKFLENALDTLNLKRKKIILGLYVLISIITILFVCIRWTSIYKILTLIIALLMGSIFIIYISADYIKNTVIVACTFGIVFTFATDFHHTLDEKRHIASALNLANGNFDYINNPLNEPVFNDMNFICDIDSFAKYYGIKYESNLTNEWNNNSEMENYYTFSSPADYNFITYIPSALGIKFADILGGSIADVYITGRLFNLITYTIMLVISLKLLPYKQKIFYIINVLPFTLLLSATCSIDGICIGIISIFIAYCLNLSEKDYKQISLKHILTLLALFALVLTCKNLAYFAIILFVLILPIFKILKNNKNKLSILIPVMVVFAIIGVFLLVKLLESKAIEGGDPRGGDTSVIGQIEFLISSPVNIIKVGFEHTMNSILNIDWYTYLNMREFFGKYCSQIFLIETIFIMYVSITDNCKKVSMRTSIVSLITFLGIFVTTSLMLYLTFTPVGQIQISGYQPRYLLPVFPIILMLVNSKRYVQTTIEEEKSIDVNISMVSGLFIIIELICLIIVV